MEIVKFTCGFYKNYWNIYLPLKLWNSASLMKASPHVYGSRIRNPILTLRVHHFCSFMHLRILSVITFTLWHHCMLSIHASITIPKHQGLHQVLSRVHHMHVQYNQPFGLTNNVHCLLVINDRKLTPRHCLFKVGLTTCLPSWCINSYLLDYFGMHTS